MKITRHNYEIYLIDYLDGNLNSDTQKELMLFLEQNPDIKNEFESIEQVSISPESMKMPGKNDLKKSLEEIPEFDSECIAYVEGDMSIFEKKKFEQEAAKSQQNTATLKLYSLTKLNPDNKIVFPNKQSLKKPVYSYRKVLLYTSMSAAAGLLLIAGFFALNQNPSNPGKANVLAQTEINFEELYAQYHRIIPDEKIKESEEKQIKEIVKKQKSNAPLHNPEFIASKLPDDIIEAEKEKVNKKKIKNDTKESNDTTKNLIIPNEILLKQNEKQMADNTVKNSTPAKKQDFLYYVEKGVKGFRSLTGKNVDLDRETDDKGNTKQFAFNIGKFKVSHTKSE